MFMIKYEQACADEISKVSEIYLSRIRGYEKKGINPLTKKLIEKARTE